MLSNTSGTTCLQCGTTGNGNYCSNCGQSLQLKRLTMATMLHEVFHFFTHLDKGFPYTLKRLLTAPGKMQKEYIEGHRGKYQKPFSVFFICASLTAFALYLIHKPTGHHTHFDEVQSEFTRHYYVLLQAALLPFYALVTWLLFRNSRINYAESLVFFTYTISFMLLIVILTNLVDLFPHKDIASAYFEIPLLFVYILWTNKNFFTEEPTWRLILKSFANICIGYFVSNYSADLIVHSLV